MKFKSCASFHDLNEEKNYNDKDNDDLSSIRSPSIPEYTHKYFNLDDDDEEKSEK